jgi:PAS domain S-box-containing protein
MKDALFRAAPVGLGAFDAELRWIEANDALAAMNRLSCDDLIGRRPSEVHGELGVETEAVLRGVLERGEPLSMAVSGELGTQPGVLRHWEVTYWPLAAATGQRGVGVVAMEITERRAAEEELAATARRDALLARASRLLSSALSVQETAENIAQTVVPELADWCFVELLQPDGGIRRVAMTHRDPAKEGWIRELDQRYPLDPDAAEGSAKVIRTGEPELLEEIPDELLVMVAQDDEHLRLLREVGFRSALVVPLIARGRTLGDIAFVQAESGRRFTRADLPLAQALADRCALALDNAVLYAHREHVAVSLQEELLPRRLPPIPNIDIGARYSAAGEGNDVGGDFYDVFAAGAGWDVVIGDVVGKGPAAAAVTGLARHTLRGASPYEEQPSALLGVLNDELLSELPVERLCSVALVRLEPADGALDAVISCAGHPLPLLARADGTVRQVGRFGTLLGVSPQPALHDVRERLEPGDLLVLYTDGVVEARGPFGFFGEERLLAIVAQSVGQAPTRVVERIEAAVLAASDGRPRDDIALIALRVRPRPRR